MDKEKEKPHWVRNPNYCVGTTEAECSECGCRVAYIVEDGRWQFGYYCPQCGTKLRDN